MSIKRPSSNDATSVSVGEVKMKKSIGLVNSITIIVGSMIGSGIFVSPAGVLVNVGSLGFSLLIWVSCGLFSLIGAYCYAELGTMIHRSGGDYSYVLEAYGPFLGFLRLWVEVMVARPAAIAIIAMTFGEYTVYPFFVNCGQPKLVVRLLAAVCILLIGFVNSISVRLATIVQDVFTYAKLAALFAIIITGLVRIGMGFTDAFHDSFEGSNLAPGYVANAFYTGLFAYSGWNYLNCMIEEMDNPKRDLPIAIVFSCLLVTGVYAMANVAYVTVLTVDEVLTSQAVAVTFAQRIYGVMWSFMPLFVAFSTFGGVNGTIMTTSRMYFVAAQEKQMPQLLCFLHSNRLTPIPAVIFTCVVSLAYLLFHDIYSLITYYGFVQWLAIGVTVLIVIIFRFTRKHEHRTVRAPILFAIIYVLGTAFLVIFAFVGSPNESLMGVGIIVTGIPVYLVGCVWKNKPRTFTAAVRSFTTGSQKLLRIVPAQ